MPGPKTHATDDVTLLAATTLTTAYASGWETGAVSVKGIDYLALKLDHAYTAATDVTVKMQNSPDGVANWRDCLRDSDGTAAVDESTFATGADAEFSLVWFVGPYNFVRFAAKGTSASGDTLAAAYSAK